MNVSYQNSQLQSILQKYFEVGDLNNNEQENTKQIFKKYKLIRLGNSNNLGLLDDISDTDSFRLYSELINNNTLWGFIKRIAKDH